MSGIAGIFHLDQTPAQPAAMAAMLSVLSRRGPDRQGQQCLGSVAMAQTLLATTPEALAEQQPWLNPADGCLVVSDSRLDNRPELLQELGIACGHADELGDARLLHAAWRRWGEDCADHLLGDFAFALWDPAQQRLFCARDTAGLRPFYFHHAPGTLFAFASEVDALLTLAEVPRAFNPVRLVDALIPQLQGMDETSTLFSEIQRLPPAQVLVVDAGGLRQRTYWTPFSSPPANLPTTEQGWIDGLQQRLETAVRRRLRASVPVGSMLSGGLDSSSLVAIASKQLAEQGRERLHTFSAVSAEPGCPETRAIGRMIEAFNLLPTCVDWRASAARLDQVAQDWSQMAEPTDALMVMVDSQYRAAAEQGVKVVFDGNNADALLSEGYYLADLLRRGHWPTAISEARGQERFYQEGWQAWGYLKPELIQAFVPARLRAIVRRWRQPGLIRKRIAAALITPAFARRHGLANALQAMASQSALEPAFSPDRRGQSWIQCPYTTAGMERYGRLAAAQGVEPRCPFMDRRLVEYCAWIPVPLRLRDGWPKWVLRRAMAAHLPQEVAWRRGKEHLGWRFNLALFERLGRVHPHLGERLTTQVPDLIEATALPLWPYRESARGQTPKDWQERLAAAAVVMWSGRNTR